MTNPILQAMGKSAMPNSPMNVVQQFMQFKQQMQGKDPQKIVEQMLADGQMSQQQIASCCCESRLATANLSAQMDRQTCDITNAIRAEGEQTRALMQANEIQQLRDKVNALQMDNRMYGVVRYPNGYTYTAGPSPFCGCGGCA